MTAHVWAQRTQSEGRGPSIFFEGPTIYSYGRHFPMAGFAETLKREPCVLINERSYSRSTSKHLGYVRGSLPNALPRFYVHDPLASPKRNLAEMDEQLEALFEAYAAKKQERSRMKVAVALRETLAKYNSYGSAFVKGFKPRKADEDVRETANRFAKQQKAREKAALAAEKKRTEKALAYAEKFTGVKRTGWAELWRDNRLTDYTQNGNMEVCGRRAMTEYIRDNHGTLLRFKGKDAIETSKSAEFPIAHAKRAFKAIASCREQKKSWERNGHNIHVGHFQIDRIDTEGNIVAGCHNIRWPEIEIMARQLGLIKEGAI